MRGHKTMSGNTTSLHGFFICVKEAISLVSKLAFRPFLICPLNGIEEIISTGLRNQGGAQLWSIYVHTSG